MATGVVVVGRDPGARVVAERPGLPDIRRCHGAMVASIVMRAAASPWEEVEIIQRLDATRHRRWIADLTVFDGQAEPLVHGN